MASLIHRTGEGVSTYYIAEVDSTEQEINLEDMVDLGSDFVQVDLRNAELPQPTDENYLQRVRTFAELEAVLMAQTRGAQFVLLGDSYIKNGEDKLAYIATFYSPKPATYDTVDAIGRET